MVRRSERKKVSVTRELPMCVSHHRGAGPQVLVMSLTMVSTVLISSSPAHSPLEKLLRLKNPNLCPATGTRYDEPPCVKPNVAIRQALMGMCGNAAYIPYQEKNFQEQYKQAWAQNFSIVTPPLPPPPVSSLPTTSILPPYAQVEYLLYGMGQEKID